MARDADIKNARLLDKRTVERSIKKGLISRKDYEKHLKSLEDVGEKGVYGAGSDVEEPRGGGGDGPPDGVPEGSSSNHES